jgi:two-component system, sensor histidine kinase PdtaS
MSRLPAYILLMAVNATIGCNPSGEKTTRVDKSYLSYITIAKNEKEKLPIRYKAASDASAIATKGRDLKPKIECKRFTGMLLLRMDSFSRALPECRELGNLAVRSGDKESEGIAYNNIALIKSELSEYDSAIFFYQKAGALFLGIRDSIRYFQSKINAGIAYKNIGDFEKAFSNSIEAARIMKNMHANDELGSAYTTLGNILKDIQRTQDALSYHEDALRIRQQLADTIGIAGSYNNIGNVYKMNLQYAKALEYFFRSLDLKKRHGTSRSRATTLDNIAETMYAMKDFDKASLYASQALSLRDSEKDKDGWMTSSGRLVSLFTVRQQYDSALRLSLQIEKTANAPIYLRHQLNNALQLQEIYKQLNKQEAALTYARKALELKDSLFSREMANEITKLNIQYKTDEQQRQIATAEKDNLHKSERIRRQLYFILLLGALLLLLLYIIHLLRTSNIQRKKAKEKTELLMSELNHRVKNNIQLITGILSLQSNETSYPAVSAALTAARNRIQSIGILHKLFYQQEYAGKVVLEKFIADIAQNIHYTASKHADSRFSINPSDVKLDTDQAVLTGLILNEVLTNIYKYAKPPAGPLKIVIAILENNKMVELTLADNGIEWNADREVKEQRGFGMQLINLLASQLKATVTYKRKDMGNICFICFAKTNSV